MNRLKAKIASGFPALKQRNFRAYILGLSVSSLGNWMQNIALPWLAFSLTHSALALGVVSALQFLPSLFFALPVGVWMERRSNLTILRWSQGLAGVVTGIFTLLLYLGWGSYPLILVFALFIGILNIFDLTARQSLVIQLVGRERLLNAVSLNSSVMNASRILGPALAALVISAWDTPFCFVVNSLSFLFMCVLLFQIKLPPRDGASVQEPSPGFVADLAAGFIYVKNNPVLARGLIGNALIGAFGFNYSVMIPVFVKDVLGMSSGGYSTLMSAIGVGCLAGALVVAFTSKKGPSSLVLRWAALCSGACFLVTSFAPSLGVSAITLAVQGFFILIFSTTNNASMQLAVDESFRTRLSSFYTMTITGVMPVGSLLVGAIEQNLGGRSGFFTSGLILCLSFSALLVWEVVDQGRKPRPALEE